MPLALNPSLARRRAWLTSWFTGSSATWRSTHEGLLDTVGCAEKQLGDERRAPDAIVVPTSRPDPHLRPGIRLALELARDSGVLAVVLCSFGAADEAAMKSLRKLAESIGGVDVLVVTLTSEGSPRTRFAVDRLPMSRAYRGVRGVRIRDTSGPGLNDVGRKRNLALLLARTMGLRHVLFLDDDVFPREQPRRPGSRRVPTLDRITLSAAVAAVESGAQDAVGWFQRRFDDNSVVHRMRAALGRPQAQFLSAGALLVRVDADTPFFPLIYNEDWLFLLGYGVRAGRRARMAVAGEVGQEPYDPYVAERAQAEEFGDILAEGWATRAETEPEFWSAQPAFWHQAFKQRKQLCEDLRVCIEASRDEQSGRMLDALGGAAKVQRVLGEASARQFAQYGQEWRRDLDSWAGRMRAAEHLAPEDLLDVTGEMREVQARVLVTGDTEGPPQRAALEAYLGSSPKRSDDERPSNVSGPGSPEPEAALVAG